MNGKPKALILAGARLCRPDHPRAPGRVPASHAAATGASRTVALQQGRNTNRTHHNPGRHIRPGGQRGLAISFLASFGLALVVANPTISAADKPEPGLVATFTMLDDNKATDVVVLPNVWLHVPNGESPTPFLPPGKLSVEWSGLISSEIRDNYTFGAVVNGGLKLEINGAVIWEATANGTNAVPSKAVRLNKGTNAFMLSYTGPAQGDAFIRLTWSSRDFAPEPITSGALSHESPPELHKTQQLYRGRELFIGFRCAKCHSLPSEAVAVPELAMDAPSLEGVGARRNFAWMAQWISDPKALRPTAHMPKLLRGAKAKEDAEAIAAFLASLKPDDADSETGRPSAKPPPHPALSPTEGERAPKAGDGTTVQNTGANPVSHTDAVSGQIETGKKLFENLHCIACHNTPGTTENDPQKISFAHVREKFMPGGLASFLGKPEEHYAWIRMPDFKLSADEAAHLAAFIQASAQKPNEASAPTDPVVLERGKALVQTAGCLNCHSLKIENGFKARSLSGLTPDVLRLGCLADNASDDSKAPQFSFTPAELEALRAFAAGDHASLTRHVPAEFAERQTRLLHCAGCHGKFEGFPPYEILGGKLKPEWMKEFIGGEVSYKPRPWIEARMPAFPQNAAALAAGLAEQHGFPPRTPAEPPIDEDAAKIGRKLVSANGGFFCVSCHAVGSMAAQQVFESQGLNLAHAGERLQKAWFQRWVRDPLRIDPTTKMPRYFDAEGRSPLTDFYDGDGTKQIEAIWQYVRLGDKMPPPNEGQ